MTELSSEMVTCFARSTAVATCCWCSCERKGKTWPTMADKRLTISDWKRREKYIFYCIFFPCLCTRIQDPPLSCFAIVKVENSNNPLFFISSGRNGWDRGEKKERKKEGKILNFQWVCCWKMKRGLASKSGKDKRGTLYEFLEKGIIDPQRKKVTAQRYDHWRSPDIEMSRYSYLRANVFTSVGTTVGQRIISVVVAVTFAIFFWHSLFLSFCSSLKPSGIARS